MGDIVELDAFRKWSYNVLTPNAFAEFVQKNYKLSAEDPLTPFDLDEYSEFGEHGPLIF